MTTDDPVNNGDPSNTGDPSHTGDPVTDGHPAPEGDEEGAALEEQWGAPKGNVGQWAACVRVVDPSTMSTMHVLELEDNECITCMGLVVFSGQSDPALVVGSAKGLTFLPRSAQGIGCGGCGGLCCVWGVCAVCVWYVCGMCVAHVVCGIWTILI